MKCEYEDCEKDTTTKAVGRKGHGIYSDKGHPGVHDYCDKHAEMVADEGGPEYGETCPNCGCMFGVN